jgi:hypothetical protein
MKFKIMQDRAAQSLMSQNAVQEYHGKNELGLRD